MEELDAAERAAEKEQQIDPAHKIARIHVLLASILYRKKDLAGSMKEIRNYLRDAPEAADADTMRALLAEQEGMAQHR
jgi:hypothetical protein